MKRTSLPDPNDVAWRRSSHSNQEGGNCVEVADDLVWHKSSYSNQEGGDCVEVADGVTDVVPVRYSKAPHGPVVCFERNVWDAFIGELKGDRHCL